MVLDRMLMRAGLLFCLSLPLTLLAGPTIQNWQTPNGAKVLFVPAPELPMVDVRVVFDGGSARDGKQPGLTSFTNTLLSQGAGDWSAQEIAERMENVGAKLEVGSLRDMAWVSVRSLVEPKDLNIALETTAAVIAKPRFAPEDVERERQAMLASLLQDEQSPGSIGKKLLYKKVYGDHPYANDPEGTRESVKKIKREDLIATHQRLYVARNAVVAIVGAVDRRQAEMIAQTVTGGLTAGEHAPPLPKVRPLSEALEEKVVFPSTQAHLLLAQPGIKRNDKDYFALYVGNLGWLDS